MGLINRRTVLAGGVASALPLVRRLSGQTVSGANDRIRVGVIGTGNRGNLLIDQLPARAEIVAVSDCNVRRAEEAASKRSAHWKIHRDYRRLLDDREIDAVIVSTHDHGRVLCCVHACQAGKDVYAEKPLTLYVQEGRVLVNAARRYGRIVQVGSQQRSMAMNRLACAFVRDGGIGKLHFVQGVNYTGPVRYTGLPEEPVPGDLDWDMWQGQTSFKPYNQTLHRSWMRWWDYSGGEMTNWGAHGIDQIQCALGMDRTGPVEFWPLPEGPEGALAFRYANGVTVRLEMPPGDLNGGAIFVGSKGRMEIIRNNFRTDPSRMVKELPPPEEAQKWRDDVALWQAKYHMEEWLESVRSRKMPSADVEIGHRSVTICHLANITRQLSRRLKWNPDAEQFTGDSEANGLLTRPRRRGYTLPEIQPA